MNKEEYRQNQNSTSINHFYEKLLLTKEVVAAANGAISAGADEIIIKDAHDSARNIDMDELPDKAKLIRGWTGDPLSMVAGIDESFVPAAL